MEQQHQHTAAVIGVGPLSDAVSRQLGDVSVVTRVACDLADVGAVAEAIAAATVLFVDLPVDLDSADCLQRSMNSAKAVVKAAEKSAVSAGGHLRHVVCTTATSSLKVIGIAARHLDALAFADDLWRRSQAGLTVTRLLLPQLMHATAFLGEIRPTRVKGQPVLALPTGSVAMDTLDEEDAARAVVACIGNGSGSNSRCLPLSAGKLTAGQMAQEMGEELGIEIYERKMTFAEFRKRSHPSALDWSNSLEFAVRVDQQLKRSVTDQLVPSVTSFRDWCRANKQQLLASINQNC